MKEALEQVVELFRAKDWKFEVDEESDLVRTGIEGDNGHWQVMAIASDALDRSAGHRAAAVHEQLTRGRGGSFLTNQINALNL